MEFTLTMNKDDYKKINYLYFLKRTGTRVGLFLWLLLLLFGLIVAYSGDFGLLGIGLLGFALTILYYWYIIQRAANSTANSKFFLPTHYEFSEKGVIATNEMGKEESVWKAFVKVKKLGDYYLLFNSTMTFYAFKTSELHDKDAFETMLKDKVKAP
jgi:hypothetical protein